MQQKSEIIDITLMNKRFQFKCQKNDANRLQQSILLFTQQLEQAQTVGSINFEHAAVMAAINLSSDLIALKEKMNGVKHARHQVLALRDRLKKVLQTELS